MIGPRLSVLVVDNCDDVADSTAELLALEGCAVRVAYRGEEALALAQAEPPDVVLLDLLLPGMDGWEVARRMREQAVGRQPIVLAVSALGTDADRKRSAEAGIVSHLLKPVNPGYLVRLLGECGRALIPPAPV